MLKKDYIQRYTDELAKMVAKVLLLKQTNQPENANETLDEFGNSFLNINLTELINSDSSTVIENLLTKNQFELTHFKVLEELLYQKYLLAPQNIKLKEITLVILQYIIEKDTDFSIERHNRMKRLS